MDLTQLQVYIAGQGEPFGGTRNIWGSSCEAGMDNWSRALNVAVLSEALYNLWQANPLNTTPLLSEIEAYVSITGYYQDYGWCSGNMYFYPLQFTQSGNTLIGQIAGEAIDGYTQLGYVFYDTVTLAVDFFLFRSDSLNAPIPPITPYPPAGYSVVANPFDAARFGAEAFTDCTENVNLRTCQCTQNTANLARVIHNATETYILANNFSATVTLYENNLLTQVDLLNALALPYPSCNCHYHTTVRVENLGGSDRLIVFDFTPRSRNLRCYQLAFAGNISTEVVYDSYVLATNAPANAVPYFGVIPAPTFANPTLTPVTNVQWIDIEDAIAEITEVVCAGEPLDEFRPLMGWYTECCPPPSCKPNPRYEWSFAPNDVIKMFVPIPEFYTGLQQDIRIELCRCGQFGSVNTIMHTLTWYDDAIGFAEITIEPTIQTGTCFSFCMLDSADNLLLCSDPFKIEENCYTAFMKIGHSTDIGGWVYASTGQPYQQIRIKAELVNPDIATTRVLNQTSTGYTDQIYGTNRRNWLFRTDLITEYVQDRYALALLHEEFYLDDKRYTPDNALEVNWVATYPAPRIGNANIRMWDWRYNQIAKRC